MEILQTIASYLEKSPEWVFLYLVPALTVAFAVMFVLLPGRRWFYPAALVLGAGGFLLVFVRDAKQGVLYLAIYCALVALLSLLFLIPNLKKKEEKDEKSRADEMYEKFHEELSEMPYKPRSSMPEKVNCFEEGKEEATAEEYGMRLSYADTLLEKLRAKKLGASDRLEAEEISRRLDRYRNKPLSEEELSALNDCLSSVLKLTAKYQL